jgi:hypothetical protein
MGEASGLLYPLVEALRRYVLYAGKLHGDDTPYRYTLQATL